MYMYMYIYIYIYIHTLTYSKCMNEVSEPDRDVIRTSSHNWNSVIALRRVRQRLFVERLSVIHAPHLFVCTHTDGWHHTEHLDMTLISCQIRESGGQPLLWLSCSDNSVNWSLTHVGSLWNIVEMEESRLISCSMVWCAVCYGKAQYFMVKFSNVVTPKDRPLMSSIASVECV